MSHRPLGRKRANRVRKAFRATLPSYIDLVGYLKDRGFASTSGEAEKIILAGRVKSESHTLGIAKGKVLRDDAKLKAALGREITEDDLKEIDVVQRHVPAKLRATIQVLPA